MKKLNNILFVAILAVLMGCNDAIDIRQPGRLDAANAFQSVDDIEQGLFAVYNQWDTTPEIALASYFCDETTIGFDSGGQALDLYAFEINPGSAAPFNFWTRGFRINNRATILIEAADGVDVDASELATYNQLLGEAYAIRAYANLEMLLYFATDVRNDSALGIPVIDFVAPLDIQPRRGTVGEAWDFIFSDLDQAASLMSNQSGVNRLSLDAVKAMRARAALHRGDYATAGTLAQQLLTAYPIANQVNYQLMFLDASNAEVIFKLERTRNDNFDGQVNTGSVNTGGGWTGSIYAFVSATLVGSPYMEMDRNLFNLIDPSDIRFDVNIAPSSVISPDYPNDPDPVNNDILVIQKHPGSEGQPLMNDLKVFRSSEMLFILAEARAAQNDLPGAAALIKQLRDARFGSAQPLPVYGSQAEAYGAILDERRVELCFEGFRFRDLKRLGTAANRGIDRNPIDCANQSVTTCTLPASDYRFALPIPIVEINANPGIREQQNPGY